VAQEGCRVRAVAAAAVLGRAVGLGRIGDDHALSASIRAKPR
jgi:hypothetical protein